MGKDLTKLCSPVGGSERRIFAFAVRLPATDDRLRLLLLCCGGSIHPQPGANRITFFTLGHPSCLPHERSGERARDNKRGAYAGQVQYLLQVITSALRAAAFNFCRCKTIRPNCLRRYLASGWYPWISKKKPPHTRPSGFLWRCMHICRNMTWSVSHCRVVARNHPRSWEKERERGANQR